MINGVSLVNIVPSASANIVIMSCVFVSSIIVVPFAYAIILSFVDKV